ncbi:hypothetical protein F2P79_011690 [Pimephales promelas]|nr:hypothetical protein F2P79_011690 [Pimephales promelas]
MRVAFIQRQACARADWKQEASSTDKQHNVSHCFHWFEKWFCVFEKVRYHLNRFQKRLANVKLRVCFELSWPMIQTPYCPTQR